MRNDVRTGMFIGAGLVFVGWVLFALFSDTPQQRRQKQLANEPSPTVSQLMPSKKQAEPTLTSTQNPAVPTRPDTSPAKEKIHIVQPGETLSSISSLYYGTPDNWQKIVQANSDVLRDSAQIRPGMRLKIKEK
jgi:nucleoid-associated protein YgaU